MTERSILLKNGTVIVHDETDQAKPLKADVLITGNKIAQIAKGIEPTSDTEVIECKNKIVAPGFVDTHRHMYTIGLRGRHGDNLLEDYMVEGMNIVWLIKEKPVNAHMAQESSRLQVSIRTRSSGANWQDAWNVSMPAPPPWSTTVT